MGYVREGKRIDAAVQESIHMQVKLFVEKIIEREKCKQTEVAARIGVTPEHLSAIKNGSKIPGYQTFNFLKILAANPEAFQLTSADVKLMA